MVSNRGFTLIEVLIAVFLLGVGVVAFTGLLVLSTRISIESERQTVAQGLVDEQLEYIRSLDYDLVGIQNPPVGEVAGILESTTTVFRNNQEYMLEQHVLYGDDSGNGENPSPNTFNADYKRVSVKATWNGASGNVRDVEAGTIVTASINFITCTPDVPSCPGNLVCPASGICPRNNSVDTCPLGAKFCIKSQASPVGGVE